MRKLIVTAIAIALAVLAVPATAGQSVVWEDFQSGSAVGWTDVPDTCYFGPNPPPGNVVPESGTNLVYRLFEGPGERQFLPGGPYGDFTLTFDIDFGPDPAFPQFPYESAVAVMARASADGLSGYLIDNWQINEQVDCHRTVINRAPVNPGTFPGKHQMRIKANGKKIKVLLDGQQIGYTKTATLYEEGLIYIQSSGGGPIYIDNVHLTVP